MTEGDWIASLRNPCDGELAMTKIKFIKSFYAECRMTEVDGDIMRDFEINLNHVLVDTFNFILKYEETSLKKILNIPVTITEAHIVDAVGKRFDMKSTVSEIANVLGVSMPTATVAVKKLERKGFVLKSPCGVDARRSIISLTDMGKKIERAHRVFHEKMVRNISRQFNGDEKDILLKAITKLSAFFKEKVEV